MAALLKNIKDFGNGTGLESRQCINLIGRDLGVSSINIIRLFKIIESAGSLLFQSVEHCVSM